MDKIQLAKTFEECFNFLIDNNFPLPVENISTKIHLLHNGKYFGLCYHKFVDGKLNHIIGLNSNFVLFGTDKAIINTIYHELLHTLPNCQNHGKVWKMYANQVNKLTGLNIKTKGGDKTFKDTQTLKMN